MTDPQFQYVQGQMRPTFPALLADYEAESLAAVAAGPCTLDVRYGPAPRQTFDFFAARTPQPMGTLVYFHAGYWQSRDKSMFRFVAPAFTGAGLNVALVNYPLCPAVSLPELVAAVRACVPAIRAHAAASAPGPLPLVLSGHSAGAHLAVELALSDGNGDGDSVAGVVALSGIFDLAPLVETTLNDKLGLDAATAAACSPVHRVGARAAPALVVVGGNETPAFIAQSRRLHDAWAAAGHRSSLHVVPQADHFSLLRHFAAPATPLFDSICGLVRDA